MEVPKSHLGGRAAGSRSCALKGTGPGSCSAQPWWGGHCVPVEVRAPLLLGMPEMPAHGHDWWTRGSGLTAVWQPP